MVVATTKVNQLKKNLLYRVATINYDIGNDMIHYNGGVFMVSSMLKIRI